MRFRDYTVIVTGASAGIGAATAQAFAREGARVVLAARRADRIQDLARRIARFNDQVVALPVDITDPAQVRGMVNETLRRFGRLEILVNNAGILLAGPVAEQGDGAIRSMFETNLFGLLACTRAVVPHMRERGYGHIVNISSIAGYLTRPSIGAYSATKHAVQAVSEALRLELASDGVRVTTICPGPVATEMSRRPGQPGVPRPTLLRVSAGRVAESILRAVHTEQREVFVPAILQLAPIMDLLLPDLLARVGQIVRR